MEQSRLERKVYKIRKGKVLVIGDIHLTNRDRGRHKDYEAESIDTMNIITDLVTKHKPVAIFFLGDLIGYADRVLQHGEFFTRVLKFFLDLNVKTQGNVYSVKGNHDMAPVTEFNTLEGIDLIKVPNYIDCENVRYHFLNYGEESEPIQLAVHKDINGDNTIANIVLGHNDYAIDEVTSWYKTDNPNYISTLKNLQGVKFIISGHIHNTSNEVLETTIGPDRVYLYYPGSICRVASNDDHEYCGYVLFDYAGDSNRVSYTIEDIDLKPMNEIITDEPDNEKTAQEITDEINKESIKEVVNLLAQRRTSKLDIYDQINRLPDELFTQRGKDYTKQVIREAKDQV